MIEAHAEGEVGRVITAGAPIIPGDSMLEKMRYLNETDDSFRRFCVFEPRGYAQMSSNLLQPPTRPDTDAGFIILQGDQAHAMSGSNCICVATVLLETGTIEMKEPQTTIRFDMPAGVVSVTADCKNGKCERVHIDMNPSFVYREGVKVKTKSFGEIEVDIAFGGIFYGLIDIAQTRQQIIASDARQLVAIGTEVHRALNQSVEVVHPENKHLKGIAYTMFVGRDATGVYNGATILPPGRIDRSPCGTGNSARMALLHQRGELTVGDSYTARSIIGSEFNLTLLATTLVGRQPGVLPRVSGRAWIHGIHQIGIDPDDPYPLGYQVSDCWGDGLDL
ncbi:MAG: proline racemase [Planctomycetota bacterium]|jgi:proline racemase